MLFLACCPGFGPGSWEEVFASPTGQLGFFVSSICRRIFFDGLSLSTESSLCAVA